MKKLAWLLCIVLGSGVARAEGDFPPVNIPFEQHILSNGLTVILHEDHKAPIVTANIWYHVGSKNERPGKTGFAHLFEHLMLNGSQHYNDDFFRPLEKIGASNVNGTTNSDRTNYYATVPTPGLDRLLWLLSDQMGYLLPAVNQARLNEQRGVVQNEKRQSENRPYGHLHETLAAALYPEGHPYSWTTIGSMEDLDHASLADVQGWFRQWYGAGNATLVVAGDIQPAEALRRVEHYFGALGGGPVLARPQRWIAPLAQDKRVTLQDHVPQTLVEMAWPIPGTAEDENTLLALAADVLGSGRNSRLYKRLVYRDRSATGAGADIDDRELASEFNISLNVKPGGDAAAAEQAAREELATFLRDGPTADELARAKTVRYAGFVRAIEGIFGKSAVLAESQIYGGAPDDYQRSLKVLREATPEQVRSAAARWLAGARVVATVTPAAEYAPAKTDADRRSMPAVGATPNVHLPRFERATLANGLKLVLAQRHEAPLVQLNLILDAGHAAAGDQPGVPGYTASMLTQGTTTRDLFAIARREEELGADVGSELGNDTSNVTLSAIKARLEPSFDLFSDVALHPAFPAEEVERLKPLRLAAIQQLMASPQGIAAHLMPQLVYRPEHPYAIQYSGLGGIDAVRQTTPEQLRAFYRRWYRPDNATLVAAGDITLPELQALAEKYFGGWSAPAEPLPKKSFDTLPLPAKPAIYLVNRSGAKQSLIEAAQLSPPRADPAHQAMFVINNVLGGKFISRLNLNLREARHWSYGVNSSRGVSFGQSTFAIRAPVETAHTAEAMREIGRELRELQSTRKPSATELADAKDSVIKSLPSSIETSAQLEGQMSYLRTYGLPDDYYDTYVDKLRALGPADLDSAARKLYTPSALVWVVVGDLARIEQPIRQLGLGEVHVLHPDGSPAQ